MGLGKKLWSDIVYKQFDTPAGYFILTVVAIIVGLLTAKLGVLAGGGLFVLSLSVAVGLLCLLNLKVAFYLSLFFAFFSNYFIRYFATMYNIDLPLGSVVDLLLILILLGIFIDQHRNNDKSWEFVKNPITYVMLVYLLFVGVQFFNPYLQAKIGYIYFIKRTAALYISYLVALYLFKEKKNIRSFLKFWFVMAFLGALYGCTQEWFGFMPMEQRWVDFITALEGGRNPLIHNGIYRKVSFFSDPTSFGMLMANSLVMSLVLMTGPFRKKTKLGLGLLSLFFVLGMAYSGTRTAYAMVPSGLVLFTLMTINNKKTLLFTAMGVMGFIILMFGPFDNPLVKRVRTAFIGSEDASLNLRDMKRALAQPLVYEHPLGGGIDSSGILGRKYDPGHYLAPYVIDSGYMKTALETGWIGLIVILIFYFVPMRVGIKHFYRVEDPELRTYLAGILAVIYALIIATYVQKSINQLPGGLILFILFAVLIKIPQLEKQNN
ncbi:O-antigen ligase family protein [Rapidithrix thailandica]|uniref:O-antigen ligase family protein n=1 Tax=Rapidithrix thailandica TaxID=413964 RepID=A0AAW9S312_9BACT